MDGEREAVPRGPATRGEASDRLFEALYEQYGIRGGDGTRDLGGSSNLNLLTVHDDQRYVVRVYRPWVTEGRLAAMQGARRHLAEGGVPCVLPLLTRKGGSWISVEGRLVEVEPYVEYDAKMDSWERLEAGLPMLGRVHTLFQSLVVGEEGRYPLATNHIEADAVLTGVARGIARVQQWNPSPSEREVIGKAEELARLVTEAERGFDGLPRQVVHGDFWDNNLLFREGRVVLVADLDFMGERARIDDLALTLYYTNSTFHDDPVSDERIRRLRALVDAYDSGLDEPLTRAERAALPLALARTPLAFIAMIAVVDSEAGARQMASEMVGDLSWAIAIVQEVERWRDGFV